MKLSLSLSSQDNLSPVPSIAELIPSANLLHYISPASTRNFSSGSLISSIIDNKGATFNPQVAANFMTWDPTAFNGYGGCISNTLSQCLTAPTRVLTPGMVFAGVVRMPNTFDTNEVMSFALGSSISSVDHLVMFGTSGQVFFQRRGIDDANIAITPKQNDDYRGRDVIYVLEYISPTVVNFWINNISDEPITVEPETAMATRNRYLYGRGVGATYGDFIVTNASLATMGITAKDIIKSLAKAHNLTPMIFPELDDVYVGLNGSYPEEWDGIEAAGDAISSGLLSSTPLHIIVAAGQSNMTGEADTGQLDINGLDRAHPDVWHMDATNSIIYGSEQPFQFRVYANASVTPAMAFARYYADNLLPDGHKVLIICAAESGTSLHTDWKKSTNTLYTAMLDYVNDALALNPSNEVKALLWSQGEADRTQTTPEATYITNFTNFASDVRSDLGADLPIIIMGCNPRAVTQSNLQAIITAQEKLQEGGANGIANVIYTPWNLTSYGDGTKFGVLSNNSDSVHFDSRANRIRGVEAAIAYQQSL